ncbi:MAG: VPLPA-CTERM sorting domain-containing protein [Pseudomonadota bacterium]
MSNRTSLFAAAAAAFSVFAAGAAANATTFVFKGDGLNVTPEGVLNTDFVQDCGTVGVDFCSLPDHSAGLEYSRDGIDLTVRAYENMDPTRLIQDIAPGDSGLGAFSEDNSNDDQTQFDAGESIEFDFGMNSLTIVDVEFNAGGDTNCTNTSDGSGEGSCGRFLLEIFDVSDMMILSTIIDITNIDVLPSLGTGARFLLTALDEGSGFVVAQFTVSEVPIPGAIPLLLSGLAGIGFAARRKKAA